ncbi:cytochrome d ubiquinol oxidase subunit II [Pacificimonas flava]|uniref:Cytochrome d ubiquinol oxidase subunit II n=2 Tax=Pacificimonas TaxID=1960290 RepID=A0A219B556_9SPHN|nr:MULTISPECIES: cytochrome d ubiquinol oxidase subunit II [Pacificimonas]MBZ6379519.1 cytochrome d ubiquinol oxidase subunit II [Pacificimonas aurantium]OWV33293.1 cytochrome d ubiquinol oxidase subunit II [Pacificimonas flava]
MLDYNFDLTVIWAVIIALAIFAYVVMDGFDLGVGILFKFFPAGEGRNRAMNSIAPVWDGNETWLILGGGGLFAAFPLAYALILPALYAPIIAMLLGLIFRGVAFEYRWRDPRHRAFWDAAFTGGSIVAALAQGITLGALLQGIDVEGRAYAGGWWDWLTPFSLLTGVSVVIGYALLGATWLMYKLDGRPHDRAKRLAWTLFFAVLACIVAVSIATLLLGAGYRDKWLEAPAIYVTSQVPLLTVIATFAFWRAMKRETHATPFLTSLALFFLTFIGLGVSMWPDIIPGAVSIWDAAAPEKSQIFMLVGALIIMPLIIAYTAYAYWVFRGKVGAEGYH